MSDTPTQRFLSDAELLLGVSRHLGTYEVGPAHASLAELEFAGRVYEMAWRLRGSGLSTISRVLAIGLEAFIPKRQLLHEVLPVLDSLGWVELNRDKDGAVVEVDERIPPPAELLQLAESILLLTTPTATERAALILIRETSRLPYTVDGVLEIASKEVGEQAAREALGALSAVQLVRIVPGDDNREVVFNPFIWQGDVELSKAALRVEDSRAQAEVGSLIEELSGKPGLPEAFVKSTEPKWINFAVSQGLVQRTVVQTSNKSERAFLFTPHLTRDPFGVTRGDPSGHVRQLVGSMIYASTFAVHRLWAPRAFVRKLIDYGEAGNATDIGTDYMMLETAGIVRVAPGTHAERKRMVLLKPDVAQEALSYIEGDMGDGDTEETSGVTDQRAYGHVERERARIASKVEATSEDHRRMVSALRETAGRRRYG
jgi:hypothetical protein